VPVAAEPLPAPALAWAPSRLIVNCTIAPFALVGATAAMHAIKTIVWKIRVLIFIPPVLRISPYVNNLFFIPLKFNQHTLNNNNMLIIVNQGMAGFYYQ
jgi:hypothetical protein